MVTPWWEKVQVAGPEIPQALSALKIGKETINADPQALLLMDTSRLSLSSLNKKIQVLRRALHGRYRSEMRKGMGEHVKRIQIALEANKIRDVFRALGIKQRDAFDANKITLADGTVVTNPVTVHEKMKDKQVVHHEEPKNLDPQAKSLATDPQCWKHLLDPIAAPPADTAASSIPRRLLRKVTAACRKKVSPQVEEKIALALKAGISVDDLKGAIKSAKAGTAPGPSLLTINMLKAAPEDLLKHIHSLLSVMWTHRYVCVWWRDKFMSPLPKKPNPTSTLENIRPIGLLEVLRKLWTGILTRRIVTIWETNDVLNQSQHGYRWRNGTPSAILRVLNKIEEAKAEKISTSIIFWDFQKAFDSITPNLIRLAWARLGVPCEHIDWFMALDADGLTFPLTPHMFQNLDSRSAVDLIQSDDHFLARDDLGYRAVRGVTQGDTMSTACWIAVYDILLDLIEMEPTDDGNTAYADDLATASTDPDELQEKADLTSAFCAFTAMSTPLALS